VDVVALVAAAAAAAAVVAAAAAAAAAAYIYIIPHRLQGRASSAAGSPRHSRKHLRSALDTTPSLSYEPPSPSSPTVCARLRVTVF